MHKAVVDATKTIDCRSVAKHHLAPYTKKIAELANAK